MVFNLKEFCGAVKHLNAVTTDLKKAQANYEHAYQCVTTSRKEVNAAQAVVDNFMKQLRNGAPIHTGWQHDNGTKC